MRFSTVISSLSLVAGVFGASIPATPNGLIKRNTVTVSTDNGTASIDVPASTNGAGSTADRAGGIADIVSKVIDLISAFADDDIKHRQAFTQNTAARVFDQFGSNTIVSNVGYDFQGTLLSQQSVKFNAKVGADVSFDVITFDAGSFTLQGDGGFQNWAYIVKSTCKIDGKSISC